MMGVGLIGLLAIVAVLVSKTKGDETPTPPRAKTPYERYGAATCDTAGTHAARVVFRALQQSEVTGAQPVEVMVRQYRDKCREQMWSQLVMNCFADVTTGDDLRICLGQQEYESDLIQLRVKLAKKLGADLRETGARAKVKSAGPAAANLTITAAWCSQEFLDDMMAQMGKDLRGWDRVRCVGEHQTFAAKP